MSDPLIELRGVEFSYDSARVVLKDLDLALNPGERLGLVGPVGCGKTTVLHLIVGLVKPTRGTITAFGSERREEAEFHEVRRRAGLVFQEPDDQLFCPTVLEDVAFGPLNLGRTREEALSVASETLRLLNLEGFEERVTYDLSGGEKRLVSIATVLAMQPDVLLLDEPTTGLDEESKSRVAGILRGLPQAMIIVSHEHEFVRDLTTRTAFLEGGRIV
ncbi:MAG: energy-coupling factor ABC transporter ATP-binding protein [Planctomycetota bacterium]|jgi:cobalt/nickel transport system ATP-binding protein